jgi:hypothetical protein
MTHESLVNRDWADVVARLGGAERLDRTARETKAFVRPREIRNAVDLLRLILAYCLGERGLRLTAAWATSVGLVDMSCVAVLYRLRRCGDWFALLVGQALSAAAPKASRGRLIRIIDATTVPKKGRDARSKNEVWRIHSAFDLPRERFGHFELTDQREGETLDRIPAVKGEIRLADRAYLQPERMARLIEAGADFVIRAGWKSARAGSIARGARSTLSSHCASSRKQAWPIVRFGSNPSAVQLSLCVWSPSRSRNRPLPRPDARRAEAPRREAISSPRKRLRLPIG